MFNQKILKTNLWVQKHKKFSLLILVVLILLIGFILFNLVSKVELVINSSWLGVIGAVIGALVGGMVTLFVSVYVHNNQLKAKSAVHRKNIIYKPLYDELMENQLLIDKENPYPRYISFRETPQTIKRHPQYTVWERIKKDSRYLQVPPFLIIKFECFYKSIDNYCRAFNVAADDVQIKINEILQIEYRTECTIQNLGESVIDEIMIKNEKIIDSYIDMYALNPRVEISQENVDRLNEIIILQSWDLDSVKELYKFKNE